MMMIGRGTFEGRLLRQKPSLELPRKPILGWLAAAGCMKKSRKLRYCKRACISSFRLFFCAFHARDHAMRDRPADCLSGYALGGSPFFLREKRARGTEITLPAALSPNSRRSAFPARFATAKRRPPPHTPAQRQSAEPCPAGLRSKLKKNGEDQWIELARIPEILRPFSYRLPRSSPQPTNMLDRFLCYFL